MLRLALILTILFAHVRHVLCEGRTWLAHPLPPPLPHDEAATTTTRNRRGGGGKIIIMQKEAWGVATPVSRVVVVVAKESSPKDKKYEYASGAFGLEPELGIH